MHRDPDTHTHPGLGDLLQRLQIDLVRLVATAVLLRVRQTQHAGLPEQREQLAGELTGRLGGRRAGGQFLPGDLATRAMMSAPSLVGTKRSTVMTGPSLLKVLPSVL